MLRDRLFNAQTEAVQNRAGGSTSKTATAAQVPAPKAQVMVLSPLDRTFQILY